jgi:hypothetical protein
MDATTYEPDPHKRDARFDALVRRQGFATRAELEALGFSTSAVSRRSKSGRWNEFVPGCWVPGSARPTLGDRQYAVASWLGDLAVVSHLSAAERLLIPAPRPSLAWFSVPFGMTAQAPEGVRLHRTRHFPIGWWADGVRVTDAARTLVDLGQLLDRDQLVTAMTHALREKLCSLDEIGDNLFLLAHKAGTGLVREVSVELGPGFESFLEVVLGRGFIAGGVLGLIPQYEIHDADGTLVAVADFADEEARLIFEADGWAAHGSPWQQARDRRRDRALLMRGFQTVRYVTDDIMRTLPATVRDARMIRAMRRAELGLPPAPAA